MSKQIFLLTLAALLSTISAVAQTGTISGKILDAETKRPLDGANVVIQGTALGSTADSNGRFEIANVPPGKATVAATYIGYDAAKTSVEVKVSGATEITLYLTPASLRVLPVIVTANAAKERETPVTFDELSQSEIKEQYIYKAQMLHPDNSILIGSLNCPCKIKRYILWLRCSLFAVLIVININILKAQAEIQLDEIQAFDHSGFEACLKRREKRT